FAPPSCPTCSANAAEVRDNSALCVPSLSSNSSWRKRKDRNPKEDGMLLSLVFRHLVRQGKLTIFDAGGHPHVYQGSPGSEFVVRLHDPKLHWKLFVNPRLYFGEAFMEGTLTIDQASIYELLNFIGENM